MPHVIIEGQGGYTYNYAVHDPPGIIGGIYQTHRVSAEKLREWKEITDAYGIMQGEFQALRDADIKHFIAEQRPLSSPPNPVWQKRASRRKRNGTV